MDRNKTKKKYVLLEKLYKRCAPLIPEQNNPLYIISFILFVIFGSLAFLCLIPLLFYQIYLSVSSNFTVWATSFWYIVGIAIGVSLPFYIALGINDYLSVLIPGLKDRMSNKKSYESEYLRPKYDITKMPSFGINALVGITRFCIIYMQLMFILLLVGGIILFIINRNSIIDSINIKIIGLVIVVLLIFISIKLSRKK